MTSSMSEAAFRRSIEIDTLARTLWGEARGEGEEGMRAVAFVILNRLAIARARGGFWWGSDVIAICQKPRQFSCWNRSDANFARVLGVTSRDRWFRAALRIAQAALEGRGGDDPTRGATHYHADYVRPQWSKSRAPTARIGRHVFYRMPA